MTLFVPGAPRGSRAAACRCTVASPKPFAAAQSAGRRIARWRLPDGRSVAFRLTAVFQAADDTWQIVQAHFSVGVPNEALGEAG